MKKIEQLQEFRKLDVTELAKKLASFEHELMNLEFRHASRQLQQTAQLSTVRAQIARAKTVLREKRA